MQFNATLLQSVVDRAYERDPAAASAEYGAEFRRDIESFVAIEAVTACVAEASTSGRRSAASSTALSSILRAAAPTR